MNELPPMIAMIAGSTGALFVVIALLLVAGFVVVLLVLRGHANTAAGSATAPEVRELAPSSAFLAGAPLGTSVAAGTPPAFDASPLTNSVSPAASDAGVAPTERATAPAVSEPIEPELAAPTVLGVPASTPPAPPAPTPPPPPPPAAAAPAVAAAPPPPPTSQAAGGVWSLQLDQGSSLVLDRAWVFGREPSAPSSHPDAEPFAVPDSAKSLSKTHLVVTPTVSGAEVVDLHSTNGVAVVRPDGSTSRLTPGVPQSLAPGCTVTFGRRSMEVRG